MSSVRLYGFVIVFSLLLAVYTMSHSSKFHVIDEVSLFAVTESLAQRGSVDTNAIRKDHVLYRTKSGSA